MIGPTLYPIGQGCGQKYDVWRWKVQIWKHHEKWSDWWFFYL